MVTRLQKAVRKIPLLAIATGVLVAVLVSMDARAEVLASIDRTTVEQNESFNLELTVDKNTSIAPELDVLENDFVIDQTTQLTNTSIVNGQVSRSVTWTISLMASRSGQLTIPSITIGGEQSNPLTITVREPSKAPPGEADVFISASVDLAEAYVQSQVLYTIKVYRAVATRQPALREPVFGGVEVLVEVVGDGRSYQSVLDNRAYSVDERTFAIFPQESGEITISPARFEARVLRAGRITGRKIFESEALTVVVKPIPPLPADYPNAAWLPAKQLTLEDSWSREPDELRAGEPISRNITISALGQLESQIPAIEPPAADGVSIYPDKPDLLRRAEADGIRGIRTDKYAMIGVDAGVFRLPELELPWWDTGAGEWRVARVPERIVNILSSADAPAPQPPAEPPVDADAAEAPVPAVKHSVFWRRIAELLAVVWALTLLAWWWSTRPRREVRVPEPVPLHKQQARYLKAARKAALGGDAPLVRQALLDWGRLQWPQNAPRSISTLATRVSAPLRDELLRLSQSSYGDRGTDWNGDSLARAIRSFAVIDESDKTASSDVLPPLMPSP